MVVLSAAIMTSKRTLVARQFVEMTRMRVDSLLGAFPKLVDSEKGKDHTFIETESIRYLYQPIEQLYVVVITNKSSNILEDLETLRLLAKVVTDTCKSDGQAGVNEAVVLEHSFDIIFGIDECISFGYRESVSLSQIKTFLKMESQDEILHNRIEESKINEAREAAKKKAKELEKSAKLTMPGTGSSNDNMDNNSNIAPPMQITAEVEKVAPVDYGQMNTGAMAAKMPGRGMQIGRKKPFNMGGNTDNSAMSQNPVQNIQQTMGQMQAPAQANNNPTGGNPTAGSSMNPMAMQQPQQASDRISAIEMKQQQPQVAINPLADPVTITIEETVTASLGAEGGLQNGQPFICAGKLEITVYDDSKADLACFRLAPINTNADLKVNTKLHPNLNKQSYNEQSGNYVLEVKDPSKKFRPNFPCGLLKWQAKSDVEESLPLAVTCWPSVEPDGVTMIVQFELNKQNLVFENVVISIPCPRNSGGQLRSCDCGEASFLGENLQWTIPLIDSSNSSGAMEMQTRCSDGASLLPVKVTAVSKMTLCGIDIVEVFHQADKNPIKHSIKKQCEYVMNIG